MLLSCCEGTKRFYFYTHGFPLASIIVAISLIGISLLFQIISFVTQLLPSNKNK